MPQEPTKYPAVQPLTEPEGTPSRPWQAWEQKVSKSVPIVGSGSPEGVVEALQYATYIDETKTTSPTIYRKMLADVAGDRARGWVDAQTLSALTAESLTTDTLTADSITTDSLTATDIYHDVGSGEGDKIGPPSTADWGWRDITGDAQEPSIGSGRPSFSQIASSGVYAWLYGTGDRQSYFWHIPHDYVPGSDIYFHVHWFGPQTATAYTKWQFDWLYAKGHNQASFPTIATTATVEQRQNSVAYRHMIAETTGQTIPGCEIDGVILCTVTRIAPAGSDVSGGVFVPYVDLHYQSTNLPTKNKAPNFYT